MNYYIGIEGVQSGPFSETEIREKLARGEIATGALCWVEGWSDWRPVSSVFPRESSSLPPPMPPLPSGGLRPAPFAKLPVYQGPTESSGLAITSLILGVLGLAIVIPAIPAVICGHIACSKIKESAGRIIGRGMAITGLVLGYLMIAMIPIGLMAAMAIPAFNKVREKSQESAIQNNLRMIDAAAEQYMLETGESSVRYADLADSQKFNYLPVITPVAGEDYTGLVIRSDDKVIAVRMADGREISHSRFYVSEKSSF